MCNGDVSTTTSTHINIGEDKPTYLDTQMCKLKQIYCKLNNLVKCSDDFYLPIDKMSFVTSIAEKSVFPIHCLEDLNSLKYLLIENYTHRHQNNSEIKDNMISRIICIFPGFTISFSCQYTQ